MAASRLLMRRLGFNSDAGYRFERGVDPAAGPVGVDRATELVLAICGGRAGPLADVQGQLPARPPVRLRTARARKLLGIALSPAMVENVFVRLALPHRREGDDFIVTPPSYRFDLVLEEDLVEEVATRWRRGGTLLGGGGGGGEHAQGHSNGEHTSKRPLKSHESKW